MIQPLPDTGKNEVLGRGKRFWRKAQMIIGWPKDKSGNAESVETGYSMEKP